jgi:hypothetical protein
VEATEFLHNDGVIADMFCCNVIYAVCLVFFGLSAIEAVYFLHSGEAITENSKEAETVSVECVVTLQT